MFRAKELAKQTATTMHSATPQKIIHMLRNLCGENLSLVCFQIAGVQIWPLPNKPDGTFDLDRMEEKVRDSSDDHEPATSLICVENTQNWCGGKVLPLEWLDDVSIAGNCFANICEIIIKQSTPGAVRLTL
jgi:hypothetical protein